MKILNNDLYLDYNPDITSAKILKIINKSSATYKAYNDINTMLYGNEFLNLIYYINPISNIYAILKLNEDNKFQIIFQKPLNTTFFSEIPNKFYNEKYLIIPDELNLNLEETLNYGQYYLNTIMTNENNFSNKINYINIINNKLNLTGHHISDTFYQFKLFPETWLYLPKDINPLYNSGDIQQGKIIFDKIKNTINIKEPHEIEIE